MKVLARACLIIVLMAVFAAVPQSSKAQGVAIVSLAPIQVGVAESAQIDATITCDPGACVAFTATLRFDPQMLRADSAEFGPFLGAQVFAGENTVDNVQGTIKLSAAALGTPPSGTENILFRVFVTGLVPGSTQMVLESLQVQGPSGAELPLTQQNSDIVVFETGKIPPFSPPAYDWEVAFVSDRDGNPEIYAMNANGSGLRRLTDMPARDNAPDWSPDGSQLAFVSDRDGNPEIYVMSADGSNPVRLTDTPGFESEPAWSPDGKQIVFVSDRDGNSEIYVMNADGTNPIRLTDNPAIDDEPAWQPNGVEISFISTRDGATSEVYLMGKDGSNPRRITNLFGANGWYPTWPPDGTRLAFTYERDGAADIYVMNPDGSNLVKITDTSIPLTLTDWSPNNVLLALASNRDGDADLYVINTAINRLFRLNDDPSIEQEPDWKAGAAPCSVRADVAGAAVQVGPGQGRSVYTYLQMDVDFTVMGQYAEPSGAIWWQLDKAQVDPGYDGESLWVEETAVIEKGSCSLVAAAEPSTIHAAPPPSSGGDWGACGSCDTCGHRGECVTSPDGQCLWDPATCFVVLQPGGDPGQPGQPCYSLSASISPGRGGSVSTSGTTCTSGGGWQAGSTTTVTANVYQSWFFTGWSGNCPGSASGTTFYATMTMNCWVQANVARLTITSPG